MSNLPVSAIAPIDGSRLPVLTPTGDLNLFNPDVLKNIEALAVKVSESRLIPQHYQGKPADCFVALYRAGRAGVDPFAWMEQTYVIHNKLGMQAQLVIALLNSSGQFKENVQWKIIGDESDISKMAAIAFVERKETGSRLEGYCSYAIAEAEGWIGRNPKWNTMTRLMLMYRSATFLMRTHCPEIGLGIKTVEEIIDSDAVTTGQDGQQVQQLFTRPVEQQPVAVAEDAVAEAVSDTKPPEVVVHEGEAIVESVDHPMPQPAPAEQVQAEPICKSTGKTYNQMRDEILKTLEINTKQKHEQLAGYLVSIKWLNEGELFCSLQDMYVERIALKVGDFRLRYCKYVGDLKIAAQKGRK